MVNFGLNSASILGIFLAVAGAGLYFMRSVRPELSRDHDIFFAAVGLLCGFILLFQGWRLDPILQFGQFLLTGTTIFFAVETIRLRKATTEQARRNSPFADDERRVSRTRVYTEAELDQIEPEDEEEESSYSNKRRLRGTSYETDEPRRTRRTTKPNSSQPRYSRYSEESDRPAPTKKRPTEQPRSQSWDEQERDWADEEPKKPRRRPESEDKPQKTSRKPRPYSNEYGDDPPAAYVDYQPIEDEQEQENTIVTARPKLDQNEHDDSDY
jgi:hypothetical protein